MAKIKNAFTIIELIVVVVIIGILFTAIFPSGGNYVNASQRTNAQAVRDAFETSLKSYQYRFRTSRQSSKEYTIENALDDSLDLTFVPGPKISQVGVTSLTNGDEFTDPFCADILNIFGNILDTSIASDSSETWSAVVGTGAAPSNWAITTCRFTHIPSSTFFDYDNATDGNVSDLTDLPSP